jgi:predicted enzyme related to lactoylglutathione lyase
MSDHGRWIWYELMSPDTAASKRFYGDLVGWTCEDMPGSDGSYAIFRTSEAGADAGGLMPLGEELKAAGVPPNWTGYICVDDCDAAAAKAQSLGGMVVRPPEDIPGIGRFAIVADPAGAPFAIMKPVPPEAPGPQAAPDATGTIGWHELYGQAPEAGFDFYAELFGWKRDEALDMGPVGKYQLFSNQDGQVGAMMKQPPESPFPYWNFYVRVGDIDAAAERAKAGGAQIVMGPMEVPGGDWVFSAVDPQGAIFSAMGAKSA